MIKYDLDETEIGYKLQQHFGDLSTIIQALELFNYCLEGKVYVDSEVELFCFAKIILDYTKHIKNNSYEIQKELNIL